MTRVKRCKGILDMTHVNTSAKLSTQIILPLEILQ